ncbi:MAG: M48 family metallopeptidase [Bacteroidota bacterium]
MQTNTLTKLIFQGLTIIVLFFATWYILSRFDWMTILNVEKVTDKTEAKLGDLFWEVFQKTEKETKNPEVIAAIDSIVTKICVGNDIDREFIKVHVLLKEDVNAFALPNGHLVVFSGLVTASENPEEVSGVLGHELAHIQLKHVMKKLMKEVGLSVLVSMTTGNGGGGEMIKETAKMLSSTAFDRSLEKEADMKAVDYMIKADINPEPFADFLYRLADIPDEIAKYTQWISTHPESKERAAYIREYAKGKKHSTFKPILAPETWDMLKDKLED